MNVVVAEALSIWWLSHRRVAVGAAVSLGLHLALMVGVGLAVGFKLARQPVPQMEVVLVNAASSAQVKDARAVAQLSHEGGGYAETEAKLRSPLPSAATQTDMSVEASAKRVKELEERLKQLVAEAEQRGVFVRKGSAQTQNSRELSSSQVGANKPTAALPMAARIALEIEAYEKRPRRRFIGAHVKEYAFASYIEQWRSKVEATGNRNYPEAARNQKIYGSLRLTVHIRRDGSLEKVELDESSSRPVLDQAAIQIVHQSAPYPPLPASVADNVDVLAITRTWTFTRDSRLISAE